MQRNLNTQIQKLEKEAGSPQGTPLYLWDDGTQQSRDRIEQAKRDNPSRLVMVFRWWSKGDHAT